MDGHGVIICAFCHSTVKKGRTVEGLGIVVKFGCAGGVVGGVLCRTGVF